VHDVVLGVLRLDVALPAAEHLELVVLRDDVVPLENRVRFVTADLLRDRLSSPARIMSRTAVRRRSWKSFPGSVAFLHAARQGFPKLTSGFP